jgi:hypothetical protein
MQVYHQNNILITEKQIGESNPVYELANTKHILPRNKAASRPQHQLEHVHTDALQVQTDTNNTVKATEYSYSK